METERRLAAEIPEMGAPSGGMAVGDNTDLWCQIFWGLATIRDSVLLCGAR